MEVKAVYMSSETSFVVSAQRNTAVFNFDYTNSYLKTISVVYDSCSLRATNVYLSHFQNMSGYICFFERMDSKYIRARRFSRPTSKQLT
jgi:hypothetical protein